MLQTDDVKIKKIKELLPPVAVLEKISSDRNLGIDHVSSARSHS